MTQQMILTHQIIHARGYALSNSAPMSGERSGRPSAKRSATFCAEPGEAIGAPRSAPCRPEQSRRALALRHALSEHLKDTLFGLSDWYVLPYAQH